VSRDVQQDYNEDVVSELAMDGLGGRLKDVRLQAGMSLRELARQADVSPSFISQIENGKSQPSVATLYSFARILNVSIDELFDRQALEEPFDLEAASVPGNLNPTNAWHPSEFANRISVVHPAHRSRLTMAEGVVWERLAATPEHGVNFMKIHYAPGATSTSTAGGELQQHDGYEYGYVLKGTIHVRVGTEEFVLHEGESLGFDSNIPHVLTNIGDDDFEGVWFVHGRRH
jgi:transcriptional regulator with XRE-family HTH domain/quercetin dioxygenase-like cupin family protein